MRQQRFPCVRCGKRLTVNQVTFHAIRCQAGAYVVIRDAPAYRGDGKSRERS